MLLHDGNIKFYVIIAQVGLLLLFWDVWASVKKNVHGYLSLAEHMVSAQ